MLWLIITITIGSIVLLTLHTDLALLILGLWAAHAVLISLLGRRVKQRAAESARQASHVTETIREVLTAAPFIKASGQERLALETVDSVLHNDWNVTRKGIQTNHLVEFFNTWLGSCFLVVLYWVGGHSVADKQMTIGALIAFLAVYNWLQPFGIALFETYFASRKVAPAVERIAEVAFSVPAKSGIIPSIQSMDIEANDLSFKHDGNSILEKVSFLIAAGSVVSVIGSRGSGKSSLTELLLGLRQPSSGTVSIGGIPLDQIDEGWLRSQILGITQEVMLRNGTILDNILYGSDNSDPDAVEQAIRHAELTDWIAQLPDGLHTQVGEQGLILSGGERQRISIARALLRKPSILILDEATSALDMRTEQRLLTHLTEQLKGTTLIFITHRMAVTRLSDQILQLQDGRIMARSA
jgi:ABC-type bacteriocin/lantibiotic exporter with double-glycine peptidase domain